MALSFPNTGVSTGPWARLDSRTGIFMVSNADGGKTPVDLTGKPISMALGDCEQGWLRVDAAGAEWIPISNGVWGTPPSPEHKPGVDVAIYSKDQFGDAPIRSCRGNSRGWNGFIAAVSETVEAAGGCKPEEWVTIKITKITVIKIGQGTSIDVSFVLAPREKWVTPPKIAEAKPKPAPKPVAQAAQVAPDDDF